MAKMTSRQMHNLIEDARTRFRELNTDMFRHYKGGVYKLANPNCFEIDVDTGGIRVRYTRISGPDYNPAESGIIFSRRMEEFFDEVQVAPIAEVTLRPERKTTGMVLRMTPVFEVTRYESLTEHQQGG